MHLNSFPDQSLPRPTYRRPIGLHQYVGSIVGLPNFAGSWQAHRYPCVHKRGEQPPFALHGKIYSEIRRGRGNPES